MRSLKLRSMIRRLFVIVALPLITTVSSFAQETDIDAEIKKAMANANKPAPAKRT